MYAVGPVLGACLGIFAAWIGLGSEQGTVGLLLPLAGGALGLVFMWCRIGWDEDSLHVDPWVLQIVSSAVVLLILGVVTALLHGWVYAGQRPLAERGRPAAVATWVPTTDGPEPVAVTADGMVMRWDVRTGVLKSTFGRLCQGVDSVAVSAQGRW